MIKVRRLTVPFIPFFQVGLFPIIQCKGKPCGLEDAERLLGNVLTFLWLFGGTVAVFVVFWGAFQFITAAGDPAKAEAARKILFAGLLGVVIVVVAWAFVRIFAQTIVGPNVPIPIPPSFNLP